ncbi:hypothetical protein ACN28S_01175 [Cystobacter fuscus]
MDLVLRPVNDRFFHEHVLSFLSLAMSDSASALQTLLGQLDDGESSLLAGQAARLAHRRRARGRGADVLGGAGGQAHADAVGAGPSGWRVLGEHAGYVGDWDEALHRR